MRTRVWIVAAVLVAGCGHRAVTPFGNDAAYEDLSSQLVQTTLTDDGGRVDWSRSRDLIAFDRIGADGYFDVWTMNPDGSDQICLTCLNSTITAKNVGQPAWSPDGRWLVVQVQKPDGVGSDYAADPGKGVSNDLWAIAYPSGQATQLTNAPNEPGRGVLHPHFSSDGVTLLWSEMIAKAQLTDKATFFGSWILHAADFVTDASAPALANVRDYDPGNREGFYENHGLSPDGATWIFSANLDLSKKIGEINDIYWTDYPSGGNLYRFTTDAYNEHAQFTNDGSRLVWMSDAGNDHGGTDYWVANRDRTGLSRLTHLQDGASKRQIAADLSMGPDGKSFVGYVHQGLFGNEAKIIRFDGL